MTREGFKVRDFFLSEVRPVQQLRSEIEILCVPFSLEMQQGRALNLPIHRSVRWATRSAQHRETGVSCRSSPFHISLSELKIPWPRKSAKMVLNH